ncbi:MAG: hypothetical protein C0504_09455 [Candidatus Solibacter sp.]|nr:hypothetical protein [Candidatus Solibacter sp.]
MIRPHRLQPAGPVTRLRSRRWTNAAAAFASIIAILLTNAPLRGQALPRVLDAPIAFVESGDGRGWVSAAGSFGLEIVPGSIRVRQGALDFEIQYVGSRGDARAVPGGGQPVPIHSFTGGSPGHRGTSAGWPSVRIEGLYEGVDLIVHARGGRLKTDYAVAPGADPSVIRVRYQGAGKIELTAAGDLIAMLPGGEWREDRPVAWQGGGEAVEADFAVRADGTVGFALGQYDRSRELIIDPTLTMSTLFGGMGTSQATAVRVDGIGDVYVAGYTDAANFPNVSPVRSRSAGVEAWVVKVRPSEGRILWATCIGGSGDDRALALALDPAGGVYVAGQTTSPDFPVASPAQAHLAGGRDAFLLKLTTAGDSIVFSTFYGGASVESGVALAAYSGGVWMAGETMSADLPLSGAAQAQLRGVQDGFLARFQSTGAMLGSTYFGGSGEEMVRALAVDGSGRPLVAGSSESADLGLPGGVLRRTPAGGRDAFVLRFNATASAFDSGTLLGGTAGSLATAETATALAVDSTGGTVIAGYTPSADFPVASAWQAAKAGDTDAFLARISPDFTALTWSTFIGGLNRDTLDSLALDSSGRIYAAGKTMSANFPVTAPVQAASGGNLDAFLMRFPAAGGAPDFSTFLGGTGGDGAMAVHVSAALTAWVAGVAGALDFPQVTPVAAVTEAGVHAFLAGVSFTTAAAPAVVSLTPASGSGQSRVFTLRLSDGAGGGYIASVQVLVNTAMSGHRACLISYDRGSNRIALNPDPGGAWTAGAPGESATLANRQCELRLAGSAVSVSGANLDLNLDLGFRSGFGGAKLIYAKAVNGSGLSTGWLQPGAWTVTGAANGTPSAMSASPSGGGGTRQVFTLQFTDPDGGGDFEEGGFSAGHAPAAPEGCTLAFDRAANRVLLAGNDGSSWSSAMPGASAVLQNSQCTVRLAGTTFSVSGTVWTVRADVEFNAPWTGTKGLFLRASDSAGNVIGWSPAGAFKVGSQAGSPPGLSQFLPADGSGGGALFEASFWDADGSTDIEMVTVLINSSHQAAGGCLILADRRHGYYHLASDSGVTWSSAAAGTSTILQNSQCALRVASSTFAYSGVTLRVRLDVAFKATFLGAKTVWSHAVDQSGRSSPPMIWTSTYTVTSAQAVLAAPGSAQFGLTPPELAGDPSNTTPAANRNPILAAWAWMGHQSSTRFSSVPELPGFARSHSQGRGDGSGEIPCSSQGRGDGSGEIPCSSQGRGDGSGEIPCSSQGRGDGSGEIPCSSQGRGDGSGLIGAADAANVKRTTVAQTIKRTRRVGIGQT